MVFMTIVEETIGRRSGLRPLALSVVAYQRSIRKVERMVLKGRHLDGGKNQKEEPDVVPNL